MVFDSFQSTVVEMKAQVCDCCPQDTPKESMKQNPVELSGFFSWVSSVVTGSAPKPEFSFPEENQILNNTAWE